MSQREQDAATEELLEAKGEAMRTAVPAFILGDALPLALKAGMQDCVRATHGHACIHHVLAWVRGEHGQA